MPLTGVQEYRCISGKGLVLTAYLDAPTILRVMTAESAAPHQMTEDTDKEVGAYRCADGACVSATRRTFVRSAQEKLPFVIPDWTDRDRDNDRAQTLPRNGI